MSNLACQVDYGKDCAMKKVLTLVIATAFFGAALAVPASAAVKAGAACSKAGLVNTSAGKKFTCIKSGKKLVWNQGVAVTKPGTKTPTSTTAAPEPARTQYSASFNAGISDIQRCRISDKRTKGERTQAIAYPATPTNGYSNSGINKVLVLPVDFVDEPGGEKAEDRYRSDLETIREYFARYSNGRARYEFLTYDKWIRANNPIAQYEELHESQDLRARSAKFAEHVQEYLDKLPKDMNLQDVSAVLIYYPRNQKVLKNPIDQQGGPPLTSPTGGRIYPGLYSTGASYSFTGNPAWAWLVHEILHAHGIAGHMPTYPRNIGMMTAGGQGITYDLLTWYQLILDWLPDEKIYCVDEASLEKSIVPINARGASESKIESIMYKVSDHEVLVIEYQKNSKWAPGFDDKFKGLMVYLVDTTVYQGRENFGQNELGTSFSPANYLLVRKGNSPPVIGLGKPTGYQADTKLGDIGFERGAEPWSSQLILPEGNTFIFKNFRIKLLSANEEALVEISKVD